MANEDTNVEVKKTGSTDLKETQATDPATAERGLVSPFRMMRRLAEDMETMFPELGMLDFPRFTLLEADPLFADRGEFEAKWSPAVEIEKVDGEFLVRAEVPGMQSDDIDVDIKDNRLRIKGEKKKETKEEKDGFFRTERSYGSFYRSVALPREVDTDTVKANLKNGVLEIVLETNAAAEEPKKIEIGAEEPGVRTAAG